MAEVGYGQTSAKTGQVSSNSTKCTCQQVTHNLHWELPEYNLLTGNDLTRGARLAEEVRSGWRVLPLLFLLYPESGWGRKHKAEAQKKKKEKKRSMEKFFLSQLLCCSHYLREANKLQISSWLEVSVLSSRQVSSAMNGHIKYIACMCYAVLSSN